ncbi:GAF domain-containing protein [Phormidium sp. LEGE 05292]|uniref:DICT sensory domain-containing protein n=1 Tax=[Phormidium] sp. LEGE 05292 TaxID=767427 RepID=UPI00188109A3|nr:DICT sensory domain-containing protein [Phormidium sp. LEGE 05292]MBE9229879.1 GAF domain-containing protein [Phormidium sp. LEGE 05292]
MIINNSVLADLLQELPHLRPQMYFKSSLTALSHAMEDQVLASSDPLLVIASFQQERFYRQEAHRYQRIAEKSDQIYVLAAPETSFTSGYDRYEMVAFDPEDSLTQEWHLVVIGKHYASCLVCHECPAPTLAETEENLIDIDTSRRFEGIWTFDRQVTKKAAEILLKRILAYRPELKTKIKRAQKQFLQVKETQLRMRESAESPIANPDPFVQRLVTYLQAGQYKLLKAYKSITEQERKERLVNSITAAIRQSLNTYEILKKAAEELGQAMQVCRCLIYRCKQTDKLATNKHEFLSHGVCSLAGENWPLQENLLFQEVVAKQERVYVANTQIDARVQNSPVLQNLVQRFGIISWLLVPVLDKGRLLGMVELHHCGTVPHEWEEEALELTEAIASQLGVALIQAEAYANLEDLNEQLEALERTRSNLIAITGHELRTPLSTIQVCLESLASEPDMPAELRQIMLNSALSDGERMRKLIQDFLTLSQLESGRVQWHPEALQVQECVDLALSSTRVRSTKEELPQITAEVSPELPLVQADGEWLVEVLNKLLDNACKFTSPQGEVIVQAKTNGNQMLEVTVADTGRGIEPNRLERVFDRFYQEEGALRRTTGGTGLGLAICRQIVTAWGGKIWAESAGKDRGSQFHFTVPIAETN